MKKNCRYALLCALIALGSDVKIGSALGNYGKKALWEIYDEKKEMREQDRRDQRQKELVKEKEEIDQQKKHLNKNMQE